MKYDIEDELIGNSITYLKPVHQNWKMRVADAIALIIIAGIIAVGFVAVFATLGV